MWPGTMILPQAARLFCCPDRLQRHRFPLSSVTVSMRHAVPAAMVAWP
jgi:hypothetical protein